MGTWKNFFFNCKEIKEAIKGWGEEELDTLKGS